MTPSRLASFVISRKMSIFPFSICQLIGSISKNKVFQKLKVRFSLIENDQVGYLNSKKLFGKGALSVSRSPVMTKKSVTNVYMTCSHGKILRLTPGCSLEKKNSGEERLLTTREAN
jgi:hypothetical protein